MISKRIFDLFCSLIGLLLLLPVLSIVALLIKCDSPGPILFRQMRVGRLGKEFKIFKFRTMYHNDEVLSRQITADGDHRITRIGGFLRRHKLDELPQLLNVIAGDMSLVGPRPEVPNYVAMYPEDKRKIILSVKPGLTDYASIEFRNESSLLRQADCPDRAYREDIIPKKLNFGLRYVEERSFCVDTKLIMITLIELTRDRLLKSK